MSRRNNAKTTKVQVMEILVGGTKEVRKSLFSTEMVTKLVNMRAWRTKLIEVNSNFDSRRASNVYVDATEPSRAEMTRLRNIKVVTKTENHHDYLKVILQCEIANGFHIEKRTVSKCINKFDTNSLYILRVVGVESESKIYLEILEVHPTTAKSAIDEFVNGYKFISENRFSDHDGTFCYGYSDFRVVYRTTIR